MATSLEASLDRIRSDSGNNPIDVIEGLDTTLTFINNLIDHPDHQRYHRIRLSNLNFKERLGHLRHALSLLGAVGFGQDPTDHDFIAVDCRDEGSQSFVLRLRQFRVAIMTAKKEMQNKFWDFERLPNDHKWVSVKGAGCYELQGRRPHMEDDFVLLDCFAGQTSSGLFCCFDGHGGREAVEFCVRSFPLNLQREILKAKVNRDMHRLIESAFLVTDAQMRRRSILESGATAAICLVIMESEERVLYSANAGDARSVLVKCSEKVTGTRISFDHKPNSGDEIARINKAG